MTIYDKLYLLCLLFPIANKWKKIGQFLSITKGDLEKLCAEWSRETKRLTIVIQIWFDKITCPVKWNTIITAVEFLPVYEPIVAKSILQKCLSVFEN